MDDVSIQTLVILFLILIVVSGFFSISETSMMALNKYQLRHMAKKKHRGAKKTLNLLGQTDRLLGSILLGNNLSNTAAAAIVTAITFKLLGESELSLTIATLIVTVALLIFSEITPKIIGASFPEKIALPASYLLEPLMRLMHPFVLVANSIVKVILWVLRIKPISGNQASQLSQEELRTLVLEGGNYLPRKHQSILANLFDLQTITVEDLMVPRNKIEAIELNSPIEEIRSEIITSNHTRLPVFKDNPDEIVGVIHLRKLLNVSEDNQITMDSIEQILREPYYIPKDTNLLTQLQNFQERHERMAYIVDEYGDLMGLITIEDIIEEIVGEFTTQSPLFASSAKKMRDGSLVLDGAMTLRDLNRDFQLEFPLDGAKTLNGLILDHLQQIPETGISIHIADYYLEILQTKDKSVKSVKLISRKMEE
ncbi:MAG: CNNM domain-containing protein [Proteobacteria bacterium]|nr:CNNM domain-containing protein [Pseudomonadota bacterium]MDA0861330.1 CNNM domain-containing protein [Pseudomonadota bacterium]